MPRAAAVKAKEKLSLIESDDGLDKLTTGEGDSDDGGGFIQDEQEAAPAPAAPPVVQDTITPSSPEYEEQDLTQLFYMFISKNKRNKEGQDLDKTQITISDLQSVCRKIGDKKSTHQDLQDMISVATNGKSCTHLGYNDFVRLMQRIN